MASSSSSQNWVYDVFPSFSGADVRRNFLSHFLKELDGKFIIAFRDNEIERSRSLEPKLKQAIRDSRIAVVVFSKNYASSSWCLNELVEIVKCKEEFGQMVIPVFYGLDPSHVRKQTEDFGRIFQETCKNKTEEVKSQWEKALTDVANILGYHSVTQDNDAKMIEEITDDVSGKLQLTSSKDFEHCVGIEDHIAKMSVLLKLESEEVRMVGIWGSSGIGKTTIARALANLISRYFQGSIYIDTCFISKSMDYYRKCNSEDYNMKLNLQGSFLSEILGKKDIKIGHLGALRERLKHHKILIIIDDLDNQVVLDTLVGETDWFGCGSRIIVITNDKQFLRAHGIDHIYEVSLPSKERAQEMFCQSAFGKNSPPEGFEELVVEIAGLAGSLPLGLTVFGSSLRGRNKEDWMDMLPRLQNDLDGNIEKTLRVSYDALGNEKDKALFRHIACLFNHFKVKDIELLLADSGLDFNIAQKNLVDKSLIHVRNDHVEMHRLLQETGRNIVRLQSIDNPGERDFIYDSEDICDVLSGNSGTKKVLGISLDMCKVKELHVHESAFKGMPNLRFLRIYSTQGEGRLHLPESFDYLSPKLRSLSWPGYPMRCMPSKFLPGNLVNLKMPFSRLEKLWDGAASLGCLKKMDLCGCDSLKDFPDLSNAVNLEKLILVWCDSLVELPFSIQSLNKLTKLDMEYCTSLETLPTGINLKSLKDLNLNGCSLLKNFPEISTNISKVFLYETAIEELPSNFRFEKLVELYITNVSQKQWDGVQPLTPFLTMLPPSLTKLVLSHIPSLVEIPSSFHNLDQLKELEIWYCKNLETLPTGINLKSLDNLILHGCSRLRSFPDISTNISDLDLSQTAIENVPWWIKKFSNLKNLNMESCSKLEYVHQNISKLKHLGKVNFYHCGALNGADLSSYPSGVAMEADNIDRVPEKASSSLPDNCVPKAKPNSMDCFNLDQDALIQQKSTIFSFLVFSGGEVPSYFTHRTTESSFTNIPLLHTYPSQPVIYHMGHTSLCHPSTSRPSFTTQTTTGIPLTNISPLYISISKKFFRFRVCAVVFFDSMLTIGSFHHLSIRVNCRFKSRLKSFDFFGQRHSFCTTKNDNHLFIWDCHIPLNKDNVPLAQMNYDHMDLYIHVGDEGSNSTSRLKEWGIRILEDCSSAANQLGNPNSNFPNVCVEDEDNLVNGIEQGDRDDVVTDTSSKQNENVILLRRSPDSMFSRMSGKEMILYFPHRTTGTSLTNIPLPHTSPSQLFFRFKAFAVVDCKSSGQFSYFVTHISCRFIDRLENHFDCSYQPRRLYKAENGIHLDIYECSFPLYQDNASPAEVNYDHVDIQLHLRYRSDSAVRLIVWGIRLIEDCSSSENQLGYTNTLQHVCEDNESEYGEECQDIDIGIEIDKSEERGDSDDIDIGSETDQFEECENSDIDHEIDQCEDTDASGIGIEIDRSEERGDSDDSDIGSETDHFEECEDSDIGNEIDQSEERGDSNETDLFKECENSD